VKIGDLVRLRVPWGSGVTLVEKVGIISSMDDMGFFIMNYYVTWTEPCTNGKMWFREDEIEVINEGG
jgi:hypothetical protein